MAEGSRRFPPPWRVDKIPGGHIVRDANGQALAHVYSRESEAEVALIPQGDLKVAPDVVKVGKRCYGASGEDNGTIVAPANQWSAPCHSRTI
jgi:hypothetical protein